MVRSTEKFQITVLKPSEFELLQDAIRIRPHHGQEGGFKDRNAGTASPPLQALLRHLHYRETNDLRLVQILLGHARIETTIIYEHLSIKEATEKGKSAVDKLFSWKDEMRNRVGITARSVQNKWEYWDWHPGYFP